MVRGPWYGRKGLLLFSLFLSFIRYLSVGHIRLLLVFAIASVVGCGGMRIRGLSFDHGNLCLMGVLAALARGSNIVILHC